jgi:hypothetical protein
MIKNWSNFLLEKKEERKERIEMVKNRYKDKKFKQFLFF